MTVTADERGSRTGSTVRYRSVPFGFVLLLILLLAAGVTPESAAAAEADRRDAGRADQREAERTESTARGKGTAAQATKTPADEEGGFTPSEEISEDFAVSFPVDI